MPPRIYLQCHMGAAGDMLTAALYELLNPEDQKSFCQLMNQKELDISVIPESVNSQGISGTRIHVSIHGEEEHVHEYTHEHAHEHSSLNDIYQIIDHYPIQDSVKEQAKQIYQNIANAESQIHGKTVSEIHFHEVGMKDAIADIIHVCWILSCLQPEEIVVSEINVGHGTFHCAHGIMPVPAPATALLLKNAPIYSDDTPGELCTPTGAALLQYFHSSYSNLPKMKIHKIGYGIGSKKFQNPNFVRAFLYEV
jgi:uncharacterized protein (TIGR00299 family) protein